MCRLNSKPCLLICLSLESSGAASYRSRNPSDREYLHPEYAIIPWDAHGGKKLTIKMALFCLCLMAAGGEGSIGTTYPPLDTWRSEAPQGFRHNTSGRHVEILPPDAIIVTQELEPVGPDPSEESRES